MSRILLYNITGDKLRKIRTAAGLLGLETVEVPPEAFAHPLGHVLGYEGFAASDGAETFTEEMMVMETLSSPLLDAMRGAGATVALKAVVTEQNVRWSSAQLCRELQREHEAMRALQPKKPTHVHKKRK